MGSKVSCNKKIKDGTARVFFRSFLYNIHFLSPTVCKKKRKEQKAIATTNISFHNLSKYLIILDMN